MNKMMVITASVAGKIIYYCKYVLFHAGSRPAGHVGKAIFFTFLFFWVTIKEAVVGIYFQRGEVISQSQESTFFTFGA